MPSMKMMLTIAVLVIVVLFIVKRVAFLKNLVG